MNKPVMISVSGIRGVVGSGLTPVLLTNFAAAAGTFYGQGRVLIGRDSRVTGEMVKSAVFAGLMSVGCDPVDLGICSTPSVEMAVKESDAVGGIIITASHNPVEWNALKLLTAKGIFLDENEGAKLGEIIDAGAFSYAAWDKIGKISAESTATGIHLDKLIALPFLDIEAIRQKKFKVAYDCVNGAGASVLPQLFEMLNCETIPLNLEATGIFAHTPEPVPENLGDISALVRETRADIGFAVDPDVDRCAIIDEQGRPIGEEYSVTLAAAFMLTVKKGPVVINMSTTRAVEDVAAKAGQETFRTKVGEIHVAKKMAACGAIIGGEGNGGVILPDLHLGRDAPVAIVLTLQAMANSGKSISELRAELPDYTIIKKKINIGASDPDRIISKLTEKYKQEKLTTIDGLKIDWPDCWVHIRKSNTEPIIRVMAEAGDEKTASGVCKRFLAEIEAIS